VTKETLCLTILWDVIGSLTVAGIQLDFRGFQKEFEYFSYFPGKV